MPDRTVEDRLREEYFSLLPEARRVAGYLEAEIRHAILPILLDLKKYEHLSVVSRVKTCESAVDTLRRKQGGEARMFDPEKPGSYTLTALNDLAGVRVLAFPVSRVDEIDSLLLKRFDGWTPDHVKNDRTGESLAFKYHGFCEASTIVRGEYQVVSSLIGAFWEVEHSAIYKLEPELRGITRDPEMEQCLDEVYSALRKFEKTFETLLMLS